MVSRVVQPKFVIGDQAFLFEICIDRLEILSNIFPEPFGLSGLDMNICDAPNWPDFIIRTLRIGGERGQQGCNKQNDPQCPSHSFLQTYSIGFAGPRFVPYSETFRAGASIDAASRERQARKSPVNQHVRGLPARIRAPLVRSRSR